jgi:hypothetical protein|tara:strand:- start:302 stop:625 length:324 start_codon:yes stop_codon:yes gene_type:complete
MRKLILFLLITSFCFAQKPQPIPPELYGNWYNLDQELLIIQPNETFTRRNTKGILASGRLELVDGELRVIRDDVEDEYNLLFYIGNTTLVITKPRSQRVWLFHRLGN